jgi:hypothetical protein
MRKRWATRLLLVASILLISGIAWFAVTQPIPRPPQEVWVRTSTYPLLADVRGGDALYDARGRQLGWTIKGASIPRSLAAARAPSALDRLISALTGRSVKGGEGPVAYRRGEQVIDDGFYKLVQFTSD